MKVMMIGVGAAGNKAVVNCIDKKVIAVEDTAIINTTAKDFPKEYEGLKIVLTNEDTGCGKERNLANEYAIAAMKAGKFNINVAKYDTVMLVTSVEGGTGSGATPIIAKMFKNVYAKNVHIVALTGFEDDIRGLLNTVEFFKEMTDDYSIHTISNKTFLSQAHNKLHAEELANNELANRYSVLCGDNFIEGSQNIDDTDILKLTNTIGYMTVEKKYFNKSLETIDDFEKIVKNMIYNSASIKSKEFSCTRLGIILNINPASNDAIDYDFKTLRETYGNPFELFKQVQWDGNKEYIAYIASGMKLPIDEVKAVYDRYIEQSNNINKKGDSFYEEMKDMTTLEEDKKFNMVKDVVKGKSMDDFLSNI